jgi:3-oxoacyl-[acyl-carrier protein] reductase
MKKIECIILIGGSGEIGNQIIRKLSDNGYNVIYTYNRSDLVDYSDLSTSVIPFKLDVCSKSDIQNLVSNILVNSYSIKGLIYNAGIVDDKLFCNMSDTELMTVFEINFIGCFNVCKVFINELSVNIGSIVIMSSISGFIGKVGQINYSVSKAALISFTKNLSMEYARFGLRVNCVAPGLINTKMIDTISKDILSQMKKEIPLKRLGEAYEVANVVNFLISQESSYITGQVIVVDGGTTYLR